MSKSLRLLAIIPLAIACASASGAPVPRSAALSKCEVRATAIPGGLRLEAIVRGTPGEVGSYQLALETSDADGISKAGQGGAFTVAAAGEVTVATNEFSLSHGQTYRADMKVSGPKGEENCTQSGSSP